MRIGGSLWESTDADMESDVYSRKWINKKEIVDKVSEVSTDINRYDLILADKSRLRVFSGIPWEKTLT